MWIFVGLGGILGAVIRYTLGTWIMSRTSGSFPWGTWLINLTGSFGLGVLATSHLQSDLAEWLWLFLGIGFLGAYTTFSTFGMETVQFIQKGKNYSAIVYVTTSVILGIIFAFLGNLLVRTVT